MMSNLPKFTSNQMIGSRSGSIFETIMKKFCLINEIGQDQDIGIDFTGTVLENNKPTVLNFNVQCKGTDNTELKLSGDGTYYDYQVKVTTINYWRQKIDTTFLVFVDATNHLFYWVDIFEALGDRNLDNQETVVIKIPKSQRIDFQTAVLPTEFTKCILRYHANFGPKVIESVKKLKESLEVINTDNLKETGVLIQTLQNSLQMVTNETIALIVDIIKYNFRKTLDYVHTLDQIDEVVRQYYGQGIFHTQLSFGEEEYTVLELSNLIEELFKDVSNHRIDELLEYAKKFEKFRQDMVYFYREMVYEDCPFRTNTEVEREIEQFEAEKMFI